MKNDISFDTNAPNNQDLRYASLLNKFDWYLHHIVWLLASKLKLAKERINMTNLISLKFDY